MGIPQLYDLVVNQSLAWIMQIVYAVFKNYGLAIVFFTIIIRLIILPLTLKQQKSALEMQKIKPYMDEINKKYKNDKEKQQQETMKLYQEHGINPMAGCLPLLIQMPILFSLYQIISKPLSYLLKMPALDQAKLFQGFVDHPEKLSGILDQNGINFFVTKAKEQIAQGVNANFGYVPNGQIIVSKVEKLINFNLLGIDLSATPHFNLSNITASTITLFSSNLWIIPLLAAGTTYLSSKMMATQTPSDNEQAQQINKNMMIMMPAVTLMFSFSMPLGMGLYWTAGNIIQIIQTYAMNNYFLPKIKEGVNATNVKKNGKNSKNR